MRLPGAQLALTLALLTACGEERGGSVPGFLDLPEPAVELDTTPSIASVLGFAPAASLFEADFTTGKTPGKWSFVGTRGQPRLRAQGLRMRSTAEARAVWELPIDADRTTHLAVQLAAPPAGSKARLLRVFWQPADEEEFVLDPSRSASVGYDPGQGELLIPLGRQPSWRGAIRALAFVFGVDSTVDLVRVRGLDARPSIARFLEEDARENPGPVPTSVEIQRLRRTALRVAPRCELTQRLRVEPGTELSFGFDLHPLSAFLPSSETRFSVGVRRGGETETLASFDVPSRAYPRLAGWHDERVPLEDLAGEDVELVLSTEPLRPDAPTGIPLWADVRLARTHRPPQGPNLLLISVDTLRADHLELYGYPLETAPALAAVAHEGVLFRECLSHAPSTLPSHASLFTGIPAYANRLRGAAGLALPRDRQLLAETLRAAGLATAGFAGGGYFDPHYGLSQGFETFSYAKTGVLSMDYSDVEFNVGRALAWLATNRDRRFFLFLHTYEVHAPYEPREPYVEDFLPPGVTPPIGTSNVETNARRKPLQGPDFQGWHDFITAPGEPEDYDPAVMQRIVASYDSEIRVTDAFIARVLRALDELHLAKDTLVVFTADHGEAFLEHGRLGHGHLYEDNLRVPLFLRMPGRLPAGLVIEDRVGLADVAPTCLELLDVPIPSGVRGVSLVPRMLEGKALPHRAIVSYDESSGLSYVTPDGRKLIVDLLARSPLAGRRELYDLNADPSELHDVYGELDPDAVRNLEERVLQVLAELPGTHVLLEADRPCTFEGSLRLAGSHAPIARQLRSFPLEANWFTFVDEEEVQVETSPLEKWLVHLHQGEGTLTVAGTLRDATGSTARVDVQLDLEALAGAPRTVTLEDEGGRRLGRLLARVVDPRGDEKAASAPSAETLQQLQNLGYN